MNYGVLRDGARASLGEVEAIELADDERAALAANLATAGESAADLT